MKKSGSAPTGIQHTLAELEQRNREVRLLREMSSLLHGCLTAEEFHTIATELLLQVFPAESGAVWVFTAQEDILEPVASWGQFTAGERVFTREDCWALRLGRVHWVQDPGSRLLCLHVGRPLVGEYLCVPMMAQGEVLGVLHLQARPREHLTEAKQQLAVAVAEQVAIALANLKVRQGLRQQALRDPLTTLFNRRYLEESLEREIRRAIRNRRPLGVIMLDLDHFKGFNDQFGHQAGDALLRALGDFMQQRTRAEDIACRYGGEEFALVLPEAPLKATVERAERLREGVKQISVHYGEQLIGGLTVSLGVAASPEHGSSSPALLRRADLALYRAKHQGRDRVVVAELAGGGAAR